jgi:hypothetical protein
VVDKLTFLIFSDSKEVMPDDIKTLVDKSIKSGGHIKPEGQERRGQTWH